MTRHDLAELAPWLTAGVGVRVDAAPRESFIRKGYLVQTDGGYALTERGYEYAARLTARLDSPPEQGGGSDSE